LRGFLPPLLGTDENPDGDSPRKSWIKLICETLWRLSGRTNRMYLVHPTDKFAHTSTVPVVVQYFSIITSFNPISHGRFYLQHLTVHVTDMVMTYMTYM
jgi:hypothetical protein